MSTVLALLVLAGSAACASSGARPTATGVTGGSGPVVVSTTTSVPASPSSGCTRGGATPGPAVRTGATAGHIVVAGVDHGYVLSIPKRYEAGRPAPLVLLFHGFGEDGGAIAALTRMPVLGSTAGVIVIAPDGPGHTWQFTGNGPDAVYVDALVARVERSWCVDTHRVATAGFSAGAAFALIYSCARAGRISAIATVAVEFQVGCRKPVPILAFHGTADPAVPYQDGAIGASLPGVKVRGTLLNMGDWARLDGCSPVSTTRTIGTEIRHATWSGCVAGTAVELYTVENGGHTWPGADPRSSPLYTTKQIDATALMLRFFAAHRSS